MIAIITGSQIGINKDSDVNRILLQSNALDEDVRTIELFSQAGEDSHPAKGCRVIIINISDSYQIGIAVSDDLMPEVDPGEKEIYSTDDPVTEKKARIKLDKDGNVVINQGLKSALNHPDTVTALNTFLIALNGQLTGHGLPGGLTIDLTQAESDTVKLPEKSV